MSDYYTHEGTGFVDATRADAIEEARKRHHLASADPEPERDGTLTGPAHEAKYGLDRAEQSAALWRGDGVHPFENRALVDGEDGAENLRGADVEEAEKATADSAGPDSV
jgi:hypothetical protein